MYLHFLCAERVIGQVGESAREIAQVDVLIAAAQQGASHEEEEELRARCLGCHLVLSGVQERASGGSAQAPWPFIPAVCLR